MSRKVPVRRYVRPSPQVMPVGRRALVQNIAWTYLPNRKKYVVMWDEDGMRKVWYFFTAREAEQFVTYLKTATTYGEIREAAQALQALQDLERVILSA